MATITASATSTIARTAVVVSKGTIGPASSPVLGLPPTGARGGRARCSSAAEKAASHYKSAGAAMLAATAATMSSPALALVDERMSTEGVGLPFGLSNNILGWILLGVFGLIWAFYFVYTSGLEEDEESGMSL